MITGVRKIFMDGGSKVESFEEGSETVFLLWGGNLVTHTIVLSCL